ncbi:hypothetical protein TNCV_146601 [Trichonephila clavipes]|nr:hypothetical protein TNCV_146601 [Trichonephila clavipes]
MPPDRQKHQIEVHEIHRGKGLNLRLSLSVALSTKQGTCDLARFHPNFEGEHPGSPISLPLPPTSRED